MKRALLVDAQIRGELDDIEFCVSSEQPNSIIIELPDKESAFRFVREAAAMLPRKAKPVEFAKGISNLGVEVRIVIRGGVIVSIGRDVGRRWLRPFGLRYLDASPSFAWYWLRHQFAG